MNPDPMTLLGVGPRILSLGRMAVRADWPVVGISGQPHRLALEATLVLGCPAFPDPCEPIRSSRLVLLESAQDGVFERILPALGPETLVGILGPEDLPDLPFPGMALVLHLLMDLPCLAEDQVDLAGGLVLLEGSQAAAERASELVRALGGVPREAARLQCLQALAALVLHRRGELQRGLRLWSEAGLEARWLPDSPRRRGDGPAESESEAGWPWPGEGHGGLSCEGSMAVLVRLLRDLDPQAARLLEEVEGEP